MHLLCAQKSLHQYAGCLSCSLFSFTPPSLENKYASERQKKQGHALLQTNKQKINYYAAKLTLAVTVCNSEQQTNQDLTSENNCNKN